LIIIGDSDEDIFDLKKLLKQKFEMKDLGELRYFLEQIVRTWDDGLQTRFNSIGTKCKVKSR
jgi:hypothetical protein